MLNRILMAVMANALLMGSGAFAAEDAAGKQRRVPMEITADGENHMEAGLWVATDHVVIRRGADILYADRVTFDMKTHDALADGDVRIYSLGKVYRGRQLRYNFDTHQLTSNDFGIVSYPLVAAGANVTTPGTDHYRIKEGFFTTDNRQTPAYRLKATTVEIYPDDEVVLKNVVIFIGDIPVGWIPIYVQSLKSNVATYNFKLGSDRLDGAYFYNTVNWVVDPNLSMSFHVDLRQKKGEAGGVDMKYHPNAEGNGIFKSYYARDNDSQNNLSSRPRTTVYPDRYRFSLAQRAPLGPDISTLINSTVLSDPYVTEDFFRTEFEHNRMPDNVVEGVFYNPNFTVSLLGRERFNRFQQTVNRFPEFDIETNRVKLADTDFAYEGDLSMVNFRKVFSNQTFLQPANRQFNYGAWRWDTFHEISYPKQYFGWLSVVPHVGGRATYWSNDNQQTPDRGTNRVGRVVGEAGTEASFKVSKSWSDVKNKNLGIDGIRHVVEPFVNIEYVPRPDINPTQLLGFDTRVPNVWAQTINVSDMRSIDSIDREAVVRPGIRNKIQTKRDGQNWDLVDWALFTDVNLDRHRNEMYQQVNDRVSNIYDDITVSPFSWLKFRSQDAIDTNSHRYDLSDNSITWQATKFYEYTLGNRFLSNTPILDSYGVQLSNSNIVYMRNFYRINEHWQVESNHQFEASSGRLQEQDYTVYRDLSAWQMALTFSERQYIGQGANQGVYVSLTLKAFPETAFSISK